MPHHKDCHLSLVVAGTPAGWSMATVKTPALPIIFLPCAGSRETPENAAETKLDGNKHAGREQP